jgi:hypothetical protein
MVGVELGRVDCGLEVESEVHVREEDVQRPLILLVAAGRAPRQVWIAAAQRERGRQRRTWTAPWRERARKAALEPEHLQARSEREAELGNRRGAVEPAAARGCRDEVAEAVRGIDVDGVAPRRLARADPGRD